MSKRTITFVKGTCCNKRVQRRNFILIYSNLNTRPKSANKTHSNLCNIKRTIIIIIIVFMRSAAKEIENRRLDERWKM